MDYYRKLAIVQLLSEGKKFSSEEEYDRAIKDRARSILKDRRHKEGLENYKKAMSDSIKQMNSFTSTGTMHGLFDNVVESIAKSEKKEEVMNKYIVSSTWQHTVKCQTIEEVEECVRQLTDAGYEDICIYEKKMTANVVKPKVEFKEV